MSLDADAAVGDAFGTCSRPIRRHDAQVAANLAAQQAAHHAHMLRSCQSCQHGIKRDQQLHSRVLYFPHCLFCLAAKLTLSVAVSAMKTLLSGTPRSCA